MIALSALARSFSVITRNLHNSSITQHKYNSKLYFASENDNDNNDYEECASVDVKDKQQLKNDKKKIEIKIDETLEEYYRSFMIHHAMN